MRRIKLFSVIAGLLCICLLCASCTEKKTSSTNTASYEYQVFPLNRNDIALHLDCMTSNSVKVKDHILLVHGLTYSSHEFDVNYKDYSLVRYLCEHGYAVWRIDITGYGQSENAKNGFVPDSQYASEDIQSAIAEIIRQTGVDHIDLLGWSWGTVTSSLALKNCSDVIDKYVMYAPILTGLGKDNISEDYHQNTWEHAASDFQLNSNNEIDKTITESEVVHVYCSNCWKYDKETSPNGGRKDLCVDSSVELIDLTKINRPCLIICGDHDPYLNMPKIECALKHLPEGSELDIIHGASHMLMVEKPYYHEFQKKIIGFLQNEQ